MQAKPPLVGALVVVGRHRKLVQPAPNHEVLAMHASLLLQVLHDFGEDAQPGQHTDRRVATSKLATKMFEIVCACLPGLKHTCGQRHPSCGHSDGVLGVYFDCKDDGDWTRDRNTNQESWTCAARVLSGHLSR